jgi:ABC-type transport system involved in multi-copper enzyme maturation permease subunit
VLLALSPLLALLLFLLYYLFVPGPGGRRRRLPRWPGVALVALLTVTSSAFILWLYLPPGATLARFTQALARLDFRKVQEMAPAGAEFGFRVQSVVVLLLFSAVVGIRCSGAVTGEREKQTWEAVLLTPISAKQLVHSKLWGVLSGMLWYLLAYAVPAVLLSALGGLASLFWTVTWLAATALAMYCIGAAGLWFSVKSKTSWRSLLATLGVGYLGGFLVFLLLSPAVMLLALIIVLILTVLDKALNLGWGLAALGSPAWLPTWYGAVFVCSCLSLSLISFVMARFFLGWAQRWIADRERTRHWHDEPVYRRARRPAPRPRYAPERW